MAKRNVGNSTGVIPAGNIVWKKALVSGRQCIVKLALTADAVVPFGSSNYTPPGKTWLRKCRGPEAVVLGVYDIINYGMVRKSTLTTATSIHDPGFTYTVGEKVLPNHWDSNRYNICTGGIHFYRSMREALRH